MTAYRLNGGNLVFLHSGAVACEIRRQYRREPSLHVMLCHKPRLGIPALQIQHFCD